MTQEQIAEWAALHAVGALDGEDLARFESYLAAGDARCQNSLSELTAVAAKLPHALCDVPLRPQVRAHLMARIAADVAGRSRTTPTPRSPTSIGLWGKRRSAEIRQGLVSWAGGIAAATLTGVIVWGYQEGRLREAQLAFQQRRSEILRLETEKTRLAAELSRREQELATQRALTALISAKDGVVASLTGAVPSAKRAYGWVMWSPEKKHGFIVMRFLPPLPEGKQYQLWAIAGERPLSAGVFDVDSIGHNALTVEVNTAAPELFAITLEPAGGLPAPSGPIVAKGTPHLHGQHKG